MLGGDGWSIAATCVWRWVVSDGRVVTGESTHAADLVWELVGDEITAVEWTGPSVLGLDPHFTFHSGGVLDLLSDAIFDTWVIHLADLTLVGPLREA